MIKLHTHTRWRPLVAAVWILVLFVAAALVVGSMLDAAGYAAAPAKCAPITACRASIAWNHTVIVDLNRRLAIANDRAGGGRVQPPPCHALAACQTLQRRQRGSRIWAEGAWQRLQHDNTIHGAKRIVRYVFHPCGPVAVGHAFDVVQHESAWDRYEINGAGDTSWWQYELGDTAAPNAGFPSPHPDISVAEAEDAWWSTNRAKRDSECGTNFSPEWSAATKLGIP